MHLAKINIFDKLYVKIFGTASIETIIETFTTFPLEAIKSGVANYINNSTPRKFVFIMDSEVYEDTVSECDGLTDYSQRI